MKGTERKHRGIQEYKQTKGLNTQKGIGQSEDTRRETAELNTLNHIMKPKLNTIQRTRDYYNKTGKADRDYDTPA